MIHRFGRNTFKLHRIPTPFKGQIVGLVGSNGMGKSTALKILAGKLKPNLGRFSDLPDWNEILKNFKVREQQKYFKMLTEDNTAVLLKTQYVDLISSDPKIGKIIVGKRLEALDKTGLLPLIIKSLELESILERQVKHLSGGEIQRFVIGITVIQHADVYMFDEPSSYLDIKNRLNAAKLIRSIVKADNFVIVADHDLSILDYMSDSICIFYGHPGVFGVVTMPYSVKEGINIFI